MTITEQALDLAFPNAPGFKGQGWSSQETAMVVRWLFASPAAWDQAMSTARAYPDNPHTVADTLHEHIVPRSEMDAIVTAGGDPAKVNWLEIAHELIERRDDPHPAGVSLAAQAPDGAPDGPAAAMVTARHLHDTGRHLTAASGHLDAAREAPAGDPDDRLGKCAASLDGAHASAHKLAAHLRDRYPDEAGDLDALTKTIGLARSVSDQAKTATTAHLTQTICNHLGHTIEHVKAMGDDPEPKVREFNADHARTHLDGATEHVGKLTRHLKSNYPAEAKHLAELADPESISGQASRLALRQRAGGAEGDAGSAGLDRARVLERAGSLALRQRGVAPGCDDVRAVPGGGLEPAGGRFDLGERPRGESRREMAGLPGQGPRRRRRGIGVLAVQGLGGVGDCQRPGRGVPGLVPGAPVPAAEDERRDRRGDRAGQGARGE